MRSQNGTRALYVILAVALAGPLSALVWGAAFSATITITGDPALCVDESTTLTAAWSTNKDVTRCEWYVDGVGQGVVSFDGATSGTSDFNFNGAAVGDYEITFRIWHHMQYADSRDASASVTITVHEPQACECECPCCGQSECQCSGECDCQCCR